ncbi:dihydroorotase [Ponticoccus sp. (in: a-proteobacteria)]|uniref:dihydroorotase n=1 Tax=Ponticoccus sp. (in: a-proteobacteria) TaxID=1925025 RepID=UPI003AB7EC08
MTQTAFLNARLIDPEADRVVEGAAVLVADGVIREIFAEAAALERQLAAEGAGGPRAELIRVDCGGKCLAPGIVDIGVKVGEPGERHKESYGTAGAAAAAGGVTTIVTRPDTQPCIDTPESLDYIRRRAVDEAPVHVLPMAALTKGRDGREMTELGFLMDAGAVAFTDCDRVVRDTKVLSRALTYARSLGALVIGHPQEPGLSAGAAATSGKFASLRGLPAVSPMAERMGLDRDIALVEMTGVRYHADQITTVRALPALERAKANGFDVTAGTSMHHLTLNEMDLADYRTFFKVTPPLRSEDDRKAVVEALRTGLIDIVGSFHTPQDEESKRLPFEEAASGAVGLETMLPVLLRLYHADELSLPCLFRALALNPAKRLGLGAGRMAAGAPADLVLFDPDKPVVLDRFALRSKSRNTPFDNARLQGKVLGTWVSGTRVFEA